MDLKRVAERFPNRQREVLQNAQHIDVYEIEVCGLMEEELLPIERGKFQGCRILRQVKVSNTEQRKELIEGILYSIGSSGNGNACFSPRHGIRAVHNGERIELLICFECENFRGVPPPHYVSVPGRDSGTFASRDFETFSGGLSRASEQLFERILSTQKNVRK